MEWWDLIDSSVIGFSLHRRKTLQFHDVYMAI